VALLMADRGVPGAAAGDGGRWPGRQEARGTICALPLPLLLSPQEPDFGDEEDEWQDVPGAAGVSSAAGGAAAGSSQGGGSLMSAPLDEEDDMEEWEDV
jgi:hypothetical protein